MTWDLGVAQGPRRARGSQESRARRVCGYRCTRMYLWVCIHAYIHKYISIDGHLYVHICICIHICVCSNYTSINICISIHLYICIHTNICLYPCSWGAVLGPRISGFRFGVARSGLPVPEPRFPIRAMRENASELHLNELRVVQSEF